MEIAINTSTLNGDIGELRTALENARRQLHSMFEQVAELDMMWDGPANEEFKRQFGNDYEYARKMCNTVESLIASMEYARGQYDTCEDVVCGIVSAISV